MLDSELERSLGQTLSLQLQRPVAITGTHPVGGGCINAAFAIETSAGKFFVKTNDRNLCPDMFAKETEGLKLLSAAGCLQIPEVINYGVAGKYAFLILQWIEPAKRRTDFWEGFGNALALLHKNSNTSFGLNDDNYIGSLAQYNQPSDDWCSFFIKQRLTPQIKLAKDKGYLSGNHISRFNSLFSQLKNIFPDEPPALLHGDLWSGNFMTGDEGSACIYDPAVYYGHREAEIAFTALFGGFDRRFYSAYNHSFPLEKEFDQRKDIFNLYPLLVHLNLFGTGYLSSINSVLSRF